MQDRRIGDYAIETEIGSGGMGTVYRAMHQTLRRPVALKLVRSEALASEDTRRRFLREARLMARISHPNVVKIYDFGHEDGELFIAMELLDGASLLDWIRGEGAGVGASDRFFDLALGIARGLGTLHDHKIIHRDIKASNLFLTREGEIKVMDLGLATSPNMTEITQEGHISGTVAFMPPEVTEAATGAATYDVYQLGLVLHVIATGKLPYPHPALAYVVRGEAIPPPRIRSMGPSLEPIRDLLARCLEPDPSRRFENGNAVVAALESARVRGSSRSAAGPDDDSLSLSLADDETPTTVRKALMWVEASSAPPPPRPGRTWSRVLPALIGVLFLGLGLTQLARHPRTGRAGDPTDTSPAGSGPSAGPAGQARAGPPPIDWLDLNKTAIIEDFIDAGSRAERRHRFLNDPLLLPLLDRMLAVFQDSEQVHNIESYEHDLEYWFETPLPAAEAARIVLHPLSEGREPIGVKQPLPDPVRRLVLRVRPWIRYRLDLPDGSREEFTSPPMRFSRDLRVHAGLDSAQVVHYSLGHPCRVEARHHRDGSRLVPVSTVPLKTSHIHIHRFRDLVPGEGLTFLVRDLDERSRFVLARLDWRPPDRKLYLTGMNVWLENIRSLEEGTDSLGVGLRKLSVVVDVDSEKRRKGLKDVVLDGRDYAMPQIILRMIRLIHSDQPEVRRGAVSAVGLLTGDQNLKLYHRFLREHTEPEDWIHAVEAMSRANDPGVAGLLLERLETGEVEWWIHWVQTYARAIPEELARSMADPVGLNRTLPERSLRLLDQVAAYMGGPLFESWLLQIPRERALDSERLFIPLALRLQNTPAALERLRQIGIR